MVVAVVVFAESRRPSSSTATTVWSPCRRPRLHQLPQGNLAPDLVREPHIRAVQREIRRGTDIVGVFPDRASITRRVGAVLAEQHHEWSEGRRYLGLDVLARAQGVDSTHVEEVTQPEVQALTA